MNKSNRYLSIIAAGLLAAAGAQAQSAGASASTDDPPKAGEASTQTRGVPNARTTNSPVSEAPIPNSRAVVRQEAQGLGSASASAKVPGRAGEASTMSAGRPNFETNPMESTHAMGAPGYIEVGVPATLPAGSPSVFEGGTPQ
jgi:hypothetical protein